MAGCCCISWNQKELYGAVRAIHVYPPCGPDNKPADRVNTDSVGADLQHEGFHLIWPYDFIVYFLGSPSYPYLLLINVLPEKILNHFVEPLQDLHPLASDFIGVKKRFGFSLGYLLVDELVERQFHELCLLATTES